MKYWILVSTTPLVLEFKESNQHPDNYVIWGVHPKDGRSIYASRNTRAPMDNDDEGVYALKDKFANSRRKARFETKLARFCVGNAGKFLPACKRVSLLISSVIEDNQAVHDDIAKLFANYCYGDAVAYGGMLGKKEDCPNDVKLQISAMQSLLRSSELINCHLNFHRIFITRMLPCIQIDNNNFKVLEREVFSQLAKAETNRITLDYKKRTSSNIGYINPEHKQIKQAEGFEIGLHETSMGKYGPGNLGRDVDAVYVAGPSASATNMIQCALVCGLRDQELLMYCMAVFGFLGSYGNHGFDEVMASSKAFTKYDKTYKNVFPMCISEDSYILKILENYSDVAK